MDRNYGEDENEGMAELRAMQPQMRRPGMIQKPYMTGAGTAPSRPSSVVERLQRLNEEYRKSMEMMNQRFEALSTRVHALEEELLGHGNGPG